jgi:hypothetical protein
LDGLDELAQHEEEASAVAKRAECLKSLNKYLRRGRKVVICCRRDKFLQLSEIMEQKAPVAATVIIADLSKAEVLLNLQHASIDREIKHHASAVNLGELLIRDDHQHLLDTLCTPFYFTTALELFDQQIPLQKRLPANKHQLQSYLIGQFIHSKLSNTPNPHAFSQTNTKKWLKWFAQRLQRRQRVTFELADLQPIDLKWRWPFHILYAVLTFLLLSSPIVLFFVGMAMWDLTMTSDSDLRHLVDDAPTPISSESFRVFMVFALFAFLGLAVGAFAFIPFSLLFSLRTKNIVTKDASKFSLRPLGIWNTWKSILVAVAFYGSLAAFIGTVGSLIQPNSSEALRNISSVIPVLVIFVLMERISNYSRVVRKFVSLEHDYQRLRTGLIYDFVRWQVVLLLLLFAGNCFEVARGNYPEGILWRLIEFRAGIMLLPFTLVLSILNAAILKHFILRTCLVLRGRIPIRYASFLNYAVDLRILEKDGGHWRFRHQHLQDYFLVESPYVES